MKIEQFDEVVATFQPKQTDDLSLFSVPVGWRGRWAASWVIEDGQYTGLCALRPRLPDGMLGLWVPECDLKDIAPAGAPELLWPEELPQSVPAETIQEMLRIAREQGRIVPLDSQEG